MADGYIGFLARSNDIVRNSIRIKRNKLNPNLTLCYNGKVSLVFTLLRRNSSTDFNEFWYRYTCTYQAMKN